MAEILHAPSRERVITTNAWAFMHWLRTVHGIDLRDWKALQHWSAGSRAEFRSAIADFARLPRHAIRLARHPGPEEALVVRTADGARLLVSRDELCASCPGPLPPTPSPKGSGRAFPYPPALTRLWSPLLLARALADLLLHADLRPDDRLLVIGPAWPWLAALLEGTTVILAAPDDVMRLAAEERATVLVAPAHVLAATAFQRIPRQHDLGSLRTIVATGGPLSPESRRRIFTWVKVDLMLLARAGNTFWGNPLEPVLARPPATPAFLTRRSSAPAKR